METPGNIWYTSLIDELKDIITEHVFISRWELVKGHWSMGKRILEDWDRLEEEGEGVVQRIADATGVSKRNIYYEIQCARKFPTLDEIPDGKNASWNKIVTKHLPESHKEKVKKIRYCKDCGSVNLGKKNPTN